MPHQRVGGIELHYDLYDFTEPWRSGRSPIVFLHGLGGDATRWLYQVPAVCAEFPVITLDLRGHGTSSAAREDFTVADMALDVVRLLRELGIGRVHLVGLSLGGMVAQQFALDYPYAVKSLVLANTMCGIPAGSDALITDRKAMLAKASMMEIATDSVTRGFSPQIHPTVRDYWIDRCARNDREAYTRAAHAVFAFDVRSRLTTIAAPTLVVTSDKDVPTPAPLGQELVKGIGGARLVSIDGAGHLSNLERPQAFNAAILEFLRSTDSI